MAFPPSKCPPIGLRRPSEPSKPARQRPASYNEDTAVNTPHLRPFRLIGLLLAVVSAVRAQALLDPANRDAARSIQAFENAWSNPGAERLDGAFAFVKPVLGYNLRHYAGYDLHFPARQFDLTKPVAFGLILSIETASGSGRTYFYHRQSMAPPKQDPKTVQEAARKISLHVSGGFYAGPGSYRYRLLIADHLGRTYRRQGRFDVKQSREASGLPADTLVPLNVPNWTGFDPEATGGHATVLVHAAPIYPRRVLTQLQPYDRYVLLTSLGALLSRGGFSSAHVIVFDLAGRRILFDEEKFDRNAMRRLRRGLEEADFGTIAFQTLAAGPTPQAVAEAALARAAEHLHERETVVFLGPAWMPSRRKQPVPEKLRSALPKVHYLALVPRNLLPQDTVSDIVRSLRGRVHSIYSPQDFVNALDKLVSGG